MTQHLFTPDTSVESGSHYETLTEAVNSTIADYKSERPSGFDYSLAGYQEYLEAKYDLIGFTEKSKCDAITWKSMGDLQDEFVNNLIDFVTAEYQLAVEPVEINENLILALSMLAQGNVPVLLRTVIDDDPYPKDLAREFQISNSLLVAFAKALDADKSLARKKVDINYMELGVSHESLTVAAKICTRLFNSYPIRFLANRPEIR